MPTEERHVGRVIFTPDAWRVQTLRNHVDNVVQLIDLWVMERSFLEDTPDLQQTRPYLHRAAEIHDMGKPQRFRLTYNVSGWSYSFAGHRFDALDRPGNEYSPYVEALAHLHHEYSVDGITSHVARLRLDQRLNRFAAKLPLDLYVLEMCDQIEASVAAAFLGDRDPTARVFMDFQFAPAGPKRYWLDPFVFQGDAVPLTIEWAEIAPEAYLIRAVEQRTARGGDAGKELGLLRTWLLDELQRTPLQQDEVTICPWNR